MKPRPEAGAWFTEEVELIIREISQFKRREGLGRDDVVQAIVDFWAESASESAGDEQPGEPGLEEDAPPRNEIRNQRRCCMSPIEEVVVPLLESADIRYEVIEDGVRFPVCWNGIQVYVSVVGNLLGSIPMLTSVFHITLFGVAQRVTVLTLVNDLNGEWPGKFYIDPKGDLMYALDLPLTEVKDHDRVLCRKMFALGVSIVEQVYPGIMRARFADDDGGRLLDPSNEWDVDWLNTQMGDEVGR